MINFKQLRKKLVAFFCETRDMRTISAGDAEAFRIHLVKAKLGENSIRRFVGRSRQLFKAAIRQEIYRGNNPFEGMAAAVGADKSREFFVAGDNRQGDGEMPTPALSNPMSKRPESGVRSEA